MKSTGNIQINSRVYWNHIYTTPSKTDGYWKSTDRFTRFLNYVKDGDKVIDLGCGVGLPGRMVLSEKKGCEVWGVDISDKVIEENKDTCPDATWYAGHIGDLDFLPESYFDVVFCGEVIEHLDDPSLAFSDAYRVLKRGGKLVITTPLEDHIRSDEHMWEYTKDDIQKLYFDAGFLIVQFEDLDDLEHMSIIFSVGEK